MLFTTEQQLKEHFVKKHLLRYGMTHDDIEKLTYEEMKKKLTNIKNMKKALRVNIEKERTALIMYSEGYLLREKDKLDTFSKELISKEKELSKREKDIEKKESIVNEKIEIIKNLKLSL